METFWKAVAAALIAAVLGLTLGKKDFSLVLSMAVYCMAAAAAAVYIEASVFIVFKIQLKCFFHYKINSFFSKSA